MGTNFYFIPKVTDTEIENLTTLVYDFKNSNIYDFTEKILNFANYLNNKKIHLGKRSAGWQFLWNHNDLKYYNPDLNSIKKFFKENEGVIYDEYGNSYTIEQFFNEEIKDWLYKDSNHTDAETYRKEHPNEPYYNPVSKELYYKKRIYKSNYGEFLINKLRFADVTEFS